MNRGMTIGYFADGPWSHKAFERMVVDDSFEIRFIVPRSGSVDKTLIAFSEKYDIPLHENIKVNSGAFYRLASGYDCDLFVSMSFNQIFKEDIINLPKKGVINCHAGKLPFYRGRNVLNWALINDEKEFGVTVHYVDTGVDTGDIILQRTCPITDADTYKTLLEKAYVACADVLYDALKMIQHDRVTAVKQSDIHPAGFYCGKRGEGDENIDWRQTSRRLFNFVRALSEPGPKAATFLNGIPVRINKAKMMPEVPVFIGTPGQILGVTNEGVIVKTEDTTLEISEIETEAALKVGSRLGPKTGEELGRNRRDELESNAGGRLGPKTGDELGLNREAKGEPKVRDELRTKAGGQSWQ